MDRVRADLQPSGHRVSSLVDVLDRVLDKGLAIAGDIKISLADVELLTIRIRLIVCSIDKAQEIGLDWWKHDEHYTRGKSPMIEARDLRRQIGELELKIARLTAAAQRGAAARRGTGSRKSPARR
ncbi:MAG: gas vesicle protein [Candidatus Rokuibacteriota bacterium]|nr:MAG: gas vesicle protein [Candidatus Rokubacteria bacterium]